MLLRTKADTRPLNFQADALEYQKFRPSYFYEKAVMPDISSRMLSFSH